MTLSKPSRGYELEVLGLQLARMAERDRYRLRIRQEIEAAIRRLGYGPGRPVRALRRPQPGK